MRTPAPGPATAYANLENPRILPGEVSVVSGKETSMKQLALLFALFALPAQVWFDPPPGAAKPPTARQQLDRLAWLAGEWVSKDGLAVHYSAPSGGLIVGSTKQVVKGKVTFFEFETFGVEKQRVVLQPYPSGKKATPFQLTGLTKQRAVFQSPKNQWPTQIVFARSKSRLRIELSGRGRNMAFDLEAGAR